MSEALMILAMTGSVLLFTIGGTWWKPARRFGIPLLFAVIAVLSGVLWWKAVCMALTLIVALSAGYGENSPYWKKALTFSLYGLSFVWLGWSAWQVITPVLCLLIFWLSNNKKTSHTFFWKGCEALMALLIAITFISSFPS